MGDYSDYESDPYSYADSFRQMENAFGVPMTPEPTPGRASSIGIGHTIMRSPIVPRQQSAWQSGQARRPAWWTPGGTDTTVRISITIFHVADHGISEYELWPMRLEAQKA